MSPLEGERDDDGRQSREADVDPFKRGLVLLGELAGRIVERLRQGSVSLNSAERKNADVNKVQHLQYYETDQCSSLQKVLYCRIVIARTRLFFAAAGED